MRHKAGDAWFASWRLTRRQLELVARGVLPKEWIRWAQRDLSASTDPAAWYIERTATRRAVKPKQ